MKLMNIVIFCLIITSHGFAIAFNRLTDIQKQIHTLLCKIALSETKTIVDLAKQKSRKFRIPNLFAVALEIASMDNKTYVFLLNNKNIISFRSGGLTVDEQETLVSQHNNIFGSICNCPDARKFGDFAYQKGLVDSEIACINFLETNEKDIIDKIQASLPKETKITHVAFHGFTTRDMCPACYHHINLYCQMANQDQSNSVFWNKLKGCLELSEVFSINFFISSLYHYPNENFLKNYKKPDVDNKGLNCIILRKNEKSGQEEQEDIYTNKLSLKEINETKGKSEDREKKKKNCFNKGLQCLKNLSFGNKISIQNSVLV